MRIGLESPNPRRPLRRGAAAVLRGGDARAAGRCGARVLRGGARRQWRRSGSVERAGGVQQCMAVPDSFAPRKHAMLPRSVPCSVRASFVAFRVGALLRVFGHLLRCAPPAPRAQLFEATSHEDQRHSRPLATRNQVPRGHTPRGFMRPACGRDALQAFSTTPAGARVIDHPRRRRRPVAAVAIAGLSRG